MSFSMLQHRDTDGTRSVIMVDQGEAHMIVGAASVHALADDIAMAVKVL